MEALIVLGTLCFAAGYLLALALPRRETPPAWVNEPHDAARFLVRRLPARW